MRIFNGTNRRISVPILGTTQKLELGPMSVSGNILPTEEFLILLTQSFTPDEIAFICAGTYEYNVCAHVNMACNFTAGSLDEAMSKFLPKEPETPIKKLEEEELKVEVDVKEDEPDVVVVETPKEEKKEEVVATEIETTIPSRRASRRKKK